MKVYAVENHPNDSRVTIDKNGIVQCLSSRMGTGGGNTPIVLIASESPQNQQVTEKEISGQRTP